jgi:hypothetical protein
MSRSDDSVATLLNEIEYHVAWLYSMALQAGNDNTACASTKQNQELLSRILQTSEAFNDTASRFTDARHDPDEALDVALILGRALKHWNRARARWHADPRHSALWAAATELANAGERLEDALAPPPFPEEEPQSAATSMPSTRRVM